MRALVLDAAQGAHRHGLREAVQEHLGALAALCPSKSAALMLDISPAQAGAAGRAALGELPRGGIPSSRLPHRNASRHARGGTPRRDSASP